jgi:hypothetical protein
MQKPGEAPSLKSITAKLFGTNLVFEKMYADYVVCSNQGMNRLIFKCFISRHTRSTQNAVNGKLQQYGELSIIAKWFCNVNVQLLKG